MKKIKKILIANRGEIAIRVMRTCRELDLESVAIYSEADRTSLHVRYAHEAYCVGKAPSSESYLNIDKIIEVAKQSGADAIHPGYGFLSENAHFALKVAENGIIFIGPSSESIMVMGDKLAAKKAVSGYDIPMVPGVDHSISDSEEAKTVAEEIGYNCCRYTTLLYCKKYTNKKKLSKRTSQLIIIRHSAKNGINAIKIITGNVPKPNG